MPAMTARTTKNSADRRHCCASNPKHFSGRSYVIRCSLAASQSFEITNVSTTQRAPAVIFRAAIPMYVPRSRPAAFTVKPTVTRPAARIHLAILRRAVRMRALKRCGAVAQLGERCVRNAEVGSSILLRSTITRSKDVQRSTDNRAKCAVFIGFWFFMVRWRPTTSSTCDG